MNATETSHTYKVSSVSVSIAAIAFALWGVILLIKGNSIHAMVLVAVSSGFLGLNQFVQYWIDKSEVLYDDMSAEMIYRTGYWSFMTSLLMWTALILLSDLYHLPHFVMYFGVLGMFVIYGACHLVIRRTILW